MTKLPRSETNCERNPNKRTTLEHTTLTNNLKIPMRTLPALGMAFCSAMMVYHFLSNFQHRGNQLENLDCPLILLVVKRIFF